MAMPDNQAVALPALLVLFTKTAPLGAAMRGLGSGRKEHPVHKYYTKRKRLCQAISNQFLTKSYPYLTLFVL
jgi:hypothetical protein